ncbi:hypothetical protein [Streptomyces californicus]|uniref:hypothetical protein n=1 Tax=Streptomyces californicus TaxID=67351 RepID=UPI0037A26E2D
MNTEPEQREAHVSTRSDNRLGRCLNVYVNEPEGHMGEHPPRHAGVALTPATRTARWWIACAVIAVLVAGAGAVVRWSQREPARYAIEESPKVRLTVRAAQSDYPEGKEFARDVELLLGVYLQRLRHADADDLARLGAPWFTQKRAAAQRRISEFSASSGRPVEAVIADPVAPGLATVELRFKGGERHVLDVVEEDGVWWVALGEGDPAGP